MIKIDNKKAVDIRLGGRKVLQVYNGDKLIWPSKPTFDTNGYDFVDMGEAGIWCTHNVGATEPHEYGLYFAWGETTGYADASSGKIFDWSDYKHGSSITNLFKYNTQSNRGTVDNITVLELEDDAAHINMGGSWRMPTKEDFQTLYDLCNSEWTTQNGVAGRLFTLKTDSTKLLFFPAAGNANSGSMNYVGSYGYYWLSSLYTSDSYYAYNLDFYSRNVNPQDFLNRYYGLLVRGFIPKS